LTQRLDRMNVNTVNSGAPPTCEICGYIEHVTLNCQVRSPFSLDSTEVNYVQNFNPRPANDHFSSSAIWVGGTIRVSHIGLIKPSEYAPSKC